MTEVVQNPHLPDWPAYGLEEDLFPALARWKTAGKRAALATLVTTHGPSPRPLGSEMAISSAGDIAGYVSGGCVEGAVAAEALAVLRDGRPRLLDYGAGSPILDIQLACGGRIGVFVRALPELAAFLRPLEEARLARRAVSVLTDLESGRTWVENGLLSPDSPLGPSCPARFVRPWLPPLRLVLAGGDPITLALLRLAPAFGLEPWLLRPRGPLSPPEGLASTRYDRRPIKESLSASPDMINMCHTSAPKPEAPQKDALVLDRWCAVYSLSHDADTDHAVALAALKSEAFCVGILGSKARIPERLARLQAAGITDADARARLHQPAGLPLAASTPSGIALSILAQIAQHAPVPRAFVQTPSA